DELIEKNFTYQMPVEVRKKFKKSADIDFDMEAAYDAAKRKGLKSRTAIEQSIEQHAKMCIENSEDTYEALHLVNLLNDAIAFRVQKYAYCMSKATNNYREWLEEDYKRALRSLIRKSV